jgi:RNA polymerase sigma-70 factor, ECF subfamily
MEHTVLPTVTGLLRRWQAGDREGLDQLLPLVERELRRMAHAHMRNERSGHTLQTTALVNEAYLRLAGQAGMNWQNRAQFLAVAAGLMREILVDHARGLCRAKRGGGLHPLALDEALVYSPAISESILELDEALTRLAEFDARKARVVELRYFAGMTVEEAAEALGVHPNTVIHDWSLARAWLKRELGRGGHDGP